MQKIILIYSLILGLYSCASYEKYRQITEELEIPAQIYQADFNQTWAAVIQEMAKGRYDIAFANQETGKVKTRWMDNTLQVNFTDSFGGSDKVKAAEYQILVNVAEGFSYGRKVTKVTVYKRQRVERDFLQGWKEIPTDGITEKTILYRIGVRIENDNKIRAIDKAKEKEALENF
ncbi:MAG: hypothetical protein CME62_07555 [Halobacteriovoraceae bacterium]|nr:hypothetical protein [Halobacteriovoraceae bacterium]|tara:strand:+ start:3715 stop:4239 length:525 start_codon:yes stop_codon:yes gene_type:complete